MPAIRIRRAIFLTGRLSIACLPPLLWPTLAGALSNRALVSPKGAVANDELGTAVASAGDVNGDGYDDVIAGAPKNDSGGQDAGRAYILLGGPVGVSGSLQLPLVDDVPDFTFTGEVAFDQFGGSVASAGDVNGDGYEDVIVGASMNDAGGVATDNRGRAYVFFMGPGADTTADLILTGQASDDRFGTVVAGAGDLNGDGYDDVIVGAPNNDAGGAPADNRGRAYVFLGGPGPDAAADLTLTGLAAGDNFGVAAASAGDVNGDGYDDVVVGAEMNDAAAGNAGAAYLFYGGPSGAGFNAVADLTLTGTAIDDHFGHTVAGAGDVNGDGYDDLVIGAPDNDTGFAGAGQAYLYLGGANADASADLTFTGAFTNDGLGVSVASAGDVNGDGFADVILGIWGGDPNGGNSGEVAVMLGGTTANAVVDLTLGGATAADLYGFAVASAGDFDGDGYDDVIAGAYGNDAGGSNAGRAYVTGVFPYRVLSPDGGETWVAGRPASVRWLGHDVADVALSTDGGATWSTLLAGVGGLDANQHSITAPGVPTDAAKLRISMSGQAVKHSTSDSSDRPFRIVRPADPPPAAARLQVAPAGAVAGDNLGWSVASAGDINGDGFADVATGAINGDAGVVDGGEVRVYFGGPAADAMADLILAGTQAGELFGNAIAAAGDVNGDGYGDLIVGARGYDAGSADIGRAYVFLGGAVPNAVADLVLTGAGAGDWFGSAVAGVGDVNRDGYDDFLVGADQTGAAAGAGRAYLYFGGPALPATAALTLTGGAPGDRFGRTVAGLGDIDGDGFDDVLVGAPYRDTGSNDAGAVYVYLGGATPNAVADLILTGDAPAARLGFAAAAAGDVDGDGFPDLIAGAPGDFFTPQIGRALVFQGGPAMDAVPDRVLVGVAAGDLFGNAVASAGDVNGDGFADLVVGAYKNGSGASEGGQAYLYHGGPGADALADHVFTGTGAGESLGWAVAGAGDVNADGFDDVIVGATYFDLPSRADAGRAVLYDLNRYHLLAPAGGVTWNVGASVSAAWSGAEPADLWLSLDGGRTYDMLRADVGGATSNAIQLLVPHAPTRFALLRLTPSDQAVSGKDETGSFFTIQASVALLGFTARPQSEGGSGVVLSWSTDPPAGPQGLKGYRLFRIQKAGAAVGTDGSAAVTLGRTRVGPELIVDSQYTDAQPQPASKYELFAVNGLDEELLVGEASLLPMRALSAWPLPMSPSRGELHVSFAATGGLGGGAGEVEVALFDVRGRRVRTVASGGFGAGYHAVTWDGRDAHGQTLAAGVYFLRATSGGRHTQMKLVVMP
jgi:hypothetical protein